MLAFFLFPAPMPPPVTPSPPAACGARCLSHSTQVGLSLPDPTPITEPTPFDHEAGAYDDAFTRSAIGRAARARFWRYAEPLVVPGSRWLELGGGTGEDACHFAERGAQILLSDSSEGMLAVAREKRRARGLEGRIDTQRLDMNALPDEFPPAEPPFDGAYANFGALNCVAQLPDFAAGLAAWLRPGAPVLLTVMGPAVPWEWGWYLAHGDHRKAFRRFRRQGTLWRGLAIAYPGPRGLARAFAPHFRLERCTVINACVPPSYMEAFMAAHPRALALLDRLDEWGRDARPLVCLADHYLAHFVRR